YLDIDLETAKQRSLGRLICPKCGASYSKDNPELMPKKNDICDDCHVKLIVREDDNEETFKKRFDTFLEETKPVLSYYQYKKKLYKIDARLEDDDIFENIKKILESVDVDKK
ncbi:MAG: adenylate kinase, partial [Clostridia bacterium]|nr:adenylate kinase [Clostridia bacterium]